MTTRTAANDMSKVLCFGELLLRFSPQLQGEWLQQNSMSFFLGGAELNVAGALAKWDVPVSYVTALPEHYLTGEIISFLLQKHIETDKVITTGNRIGTYYLPQGADLKSAGVIYDREHSSFSELKPGQVDWNDILRDVSWFHFSAISPALNEDTAMVCLEAVKAASSKGITISVDLNHRPKLWQYGKMPHEVMPEFVAHCDVVMGNIWSAGTMLNTDIDEYIHDNRSIEKYSAHASRTSEEITKKFAKCKVVANTFRFDDAYGFIEYHTSLYINGMHYNSKHFTNIKVTDRSGSGDCFMAGLIYGITNHLSSQETVDFATAAAVGKLNERGDATSQTIEDIWKLAKE